MYGNGANELLIGSVAQEGDNRSKLFIITKVTPIFFLLHNQSYSMLTHMINV